MTKAAISRSIRKLPVTERIALVDELIHSIAEDHAEIPVMAAQINMIDDCLSEIEAHPRRGMALTTFRQKLKQTAGRLKKRSRAKDACIYFP